MAFSKLSGEYRSFVRYVSNIPASPILVSLNFDLFTGLLREQLTQNMTYCEEFRVYFTRCRVRILRFPICESRPLTKLVSQISSNLTLLEVNNPAIEARWEKWDKDKLARVLVHHHKYADLPSFFEDTGKLFVCSKLFISSPSISLTISQWYISIRERTLLRRDDSVPHHSTTWETSHPV